MDQTQDRRQHAGIDVDGEQGRLADEPGERLVDPGDMLGRDIGKRQQHQHERCDPDDPAGQATRKAGRHMHEIAEREQQQERDQQAHGNVAAFAHQASTTSGVPVPFAWHAST